MRARSSGLLEYEARCPHRLQASWNIWIPVGLTSKFQLMAKTADGYSATVIEPAAKV